MTIAGTTNRCIILFLLIILAGSFTWSNAALAGPLTLGGAIAGFIVAMITIFKKTWAPVTAPIYALLQGLFLGGISRMFNEQYQGLPLQAVLLTFGVMAAMLFLYQSRILRVTDKFRMIIVAATAGIAIFYVATLVLGFFGIQIPKVYEAGPIGILFSLFVVGIAAFNLALDFDFIEKGVRAAAPRYMEWYAAFGLMVTLIWLYLEILRLLSKLQRR